MRETCRWLTNAMIDNDRADKLIIRAGSESKETRKSDKKREMRKESCMHQWCAITMRCTKRVGRDRSIFYASPWCHSGSTLKSLYVISKGAALRADPNDEASHRSLAWENVSERTQSAIVLLENAHCNRECSLFLCEHTQWEFIINVVINAVEKRIGNSSLVKE